MTTPSTQLDPNGQALRLFAPDGGKDAVLSGGQFFALLRVIMHMREGQKLDRKLAFDQGECLRVSEEDGEDTPPRACTPHAISSNQARAHPHVPSC